MNKPTPKKATLAGTKRALHDMMQQDGLTFPATPDDVERIEAEIDDSRMPTPDVNGFRQFLHGAPAVPLPDASKILPFANATLANDLALAARNGREIESEIRRRMNEHRAAAEAKGKK